MYIYSLFYGKMCFALDLEGMNIWKLWEPIHFLPRSQMKRTEPFAHAFQIECQAH